MLNQWRWRTNTHPFTAVGRPGEPARFVIEQVSDRGFCIHESGAFQYLPPDGSEPIIVDHESLTDSDLASVPLALTWFVSRHGRHTPAALVHDQLVTPDGTYQERIAADDHFLEAMRSLDVPPVRRYVMWAAVTAASRQHAGGPRRWGLWLWALAATAGMVLLGAGLVTANAWWVAISLVAPLGASVLWGERYRAGMIAGYALPPVVFPALGSWLGYGIYWLVEQAVRLAQSVRPTRTLEDLPAPPEFKDL